MKARDLSRLADLAQLMLDHQLANLRQAAEAKARSEMALGALALPETGPQNDLKGAAGDMSRLVYQRWADARRAEINLALAQQTRAWLDAREAAQLAFGKSRALGELAKKQRV